MLAARLIATLGLAATLGSTAVASADECMCAYPIGSLSLGSVSLGSVSLSSGSRDADAEPAQSVEVGPFFSSDGTMLMSRVRLEHSDRHGWRVAPFAPLEDVLWCASADDPRCSPAEPGPEDGPQASRASSIGASQGERPDLTGPPERTARAFGSAGGPADGARHRLERPPRRA